MKLLLHYTFTSELAALHEAEAEQKEFPITDERTPKAGFAAHTMGAE